MPMLQNGQMIRENSGKICYILKMENSEEVRQMLKNPHRIRKLRISKFAINRG